MATAVEMAAKVGRSGRVPVTLGRDTEVLMPVSVKDAKTIFGRLQLLVVPIGGSGEAWVSADRVTLDP